MRTKETDNIGEDISEQYLMSGLSPLEFMKIFAWKNVSINEEVLSFTVFGEDAVYDVYYSEERNRWYCKC